MKVKIFSIEKGLEEYSDVVAVRIKSKDYNLLIFKGYLSIIGEIEGSFEVELTNDKVVYKDIKAYYVNNDDVFNIILGNTL